MSNYHQSAHSNASIAIIASIVAVCVAIFYPFYSDFVRGFGLFVLHVGLAATIGGGMGLGLAKLIQRSDGLAVSVVRLLRLGQWLPFFVLWGLPSWKPGNSQGANVAALETLFLGTIVVVPMIFLSSCYFTLSSIISTSGAVRNTGFKTAKLVFLHSLLVCLLWQMWIPSSGWPWYWFALTPSPFIGVAVLFLLGAVVWLLNTCARVSWPHDLDIKKSLIHWQSKHFTAKSFVGATLIVIASVLFWQLFKDGLREYLLLAPPSEVLAALYRLLVTGSTAFPQAGATIWRDLNVSLLEVTAGLALAGLIGVAFTKMLDTSERANQVLYRIASLAEVAPIGLWMILFVTIPGFITFWSKATLVGCLAFYPLISTLRCFKDYPATCRWLLALEQSMPFAFVGMIFGEMFGGTVGLSFVVAVAHATLRLTDAAAVSLLEFGLLAMISCGIRFVVKRIYLSTSQESV